MRIRAAKDGTIGEHGAACLHGALTRADEVCGGFLTTGTFARVRMRVSAKGQGHLITLLADHHLQWE